MIIVFKLFSRREDLQRLNKFVEEQQKETSAHMEKQDIDVTKFNSFLGVLFCLSK